MTLDAVGQRSWRKFTDSGSAKLEMDSPGAMSATPLLDRPQKSRRFGEVKGGTKEYPFNFRPAT
jgi:hypothetical protein